MIISFAWTTDAFLTGKKTVTRRFWDDNYARLFKPGMIVDAYDKSPRFNGEKIGELRIIKVFKQPLREMTDADEVKEGGLWGNAKNFIEQMGGPGLIPWVIEFDPILKLPEVDENPDLFKLAREL